MIEDIIKKIEDEDVAVYNTSIYKGELPLDKKDVLAAIYAVSPTPHKTFDIYEQHIEFWAKYANSDESFAKLKLIQTLFHRKYAYALEHHYVYFSNAIAMIEDMGRDSNRNKLAKLSMRFIYRPSA